MGGSSQCDLSFSTYNIDENLVKINREPKRIYMIVEDIEDDMTKFVDIDVNAFRAKVLTMNKNKQKS